ncbi:phosphoribosylformylglycinamidine cyclo-ligase [Limnoglobus roseus]|uniref:Phosphoribosylformylglycinamidine cyclo-ligase n=1 Tax=Limnoglobus roseus TaxID=2598579 RepID=A0A5C1A6I4_9BACT|nr:phosphoribosylformylglycinamidine cyclo-ligase [Limnoglobus roseus]QEL14350.1 phosphoribosylformylglycinamidine cyclo-ligase [Limnoglobus roseus]
MAKSLTYQDAGLNLETYAETMSGVQKLIAKTWGPNVIRSPFKGAGGKGGSFASLFDLDPPGGGGLFARIFSRKYARPVLVTCTDGVGSKLKIAMLCGKYDTVGIDLVAMSVNDLICTGGEPLMFLDYLAMDKDDPARTVQLVKGVADGCIESDCALVGGETAILPDFYQPGEFDMAGFCTGVVEHSGIIDGSRIEVGDAVIGLAASGVHSNGYSLVRKAVFDAGKLTVDAHVPELGTTVGDALLTPTRLYVRPVRKVLEHYPVKKKGVIHGLANITGGGLPDNIGRILPPGRRVKIRRGSWTPNPVFPWLQKLGNIEQAEMERVFNMGIGFVMIVSPSFADSIRNQLKAAGVEAWPIGEVTAGEAGVEMV